MFPGVSVFDGPACCGNWEPRSRALCQREGNGCITGCWAVDNAGKWRGAWEDALPAFIHAN